MVSIRVIIPFILFWVLMTKFGTSFSPASVRTPLRTLPLACIMAQEHVGEPGLIIDARKLSRSDFRRYYEGKVPVILRNVYDFDNDCYIEEMMNRMAKEVIEFDVRKDREVDTYEARMDDFVGAMMESKHTASFYFMDEQILSRVGQDRIHELDFPTRLFGRDLFDFFPSLVRPKSALILGGMGSRSFLHADPYEWIGSNYLFEGRKLWTFIPPDADVEAPVSTDRGMSGMRAARDAPVGEAEAKRGYATASEIFGYRRQSPDAWGGIFNLSAGWVSEVDLYSQGDADGESSLNQYLEAAQLNEEWLGDCYDDDGAVLGSSLLRTHHRGSVPLFRSGQPEVDGCDVRALKGSLQILQEEGDLLIIPPRWWHQVYNLQPTVAVASQYMNEGSLDRVLDHMLSWNSLTRRSGKLPRGFAALSPRARILTTIEACLVGRHGPNKGLRAFRRLATLTAGTAGQRAGSRNMKYEPLSVDAAVGAAVEREQVQAKERENAEAEVKSPQPRAQSQPTRVLAANKGKGKYSKGIRSSRRDLRSRLVNTELRKGLKRGRDSEFL